MEVSAASSKHKPENMDIRHMITSTSIKVFLNCCNILEKTNVILDKDKNIYFSISVKASSTIGSSKKIYIKLEFNTTVTFRSFELSLISNFAELKFHPKVNLLDSKIYEDTIFTNKLNPQIYLFNQISCIFLYESNHLKNIRKSIETALTSQEFSDLTIIVKNKEFNVHKIIVCSQSKVFKKMIETEMIEKKLNRIDLKNSVEISVFEEILKFIYQGKCNLSSNNVDKIFHFSHQYEIADLQNDCQFYMLENVSNLDITETLKLINIKNYNLNALKISFMKYINENEVNVVKDEKYVNYLVDNMTIENIHHIFKLCMVYKLKQVTKVKDFIFENLEQVLNNENLVRLLLDSPNYMLDILKTLAVSKFYQFEKIQCSKPKRKNRK